MNGLPKVTIWQEIAQDRREEIGLLQAELDETKKTLSHQIKCLSNCQVAREQLQAALEIMTTDRDLHLRWLKAHRWIPVSERLPKEGIAMLTLMVGGYIGRCTLIDDEWQHMGEDIVTHWKPIILPEQEKAGKDVFLTQEERVAAYHKSIGDKWDGERWVTEKPIILPGEEASDVDSKKTTETE